MFFELARWAELYPHIPGVEIQSQPLWCGHFVRANPISPFLLKIRPPLGL
jgi:hypothetical protein